MSTYKLTYFPVTALGEPIRWLMSYLDIKFEDYRFEREQWPSIKPTTPFGQVPVLEIDGKAVWQSVAISRYFGKKADLAGKDEWESLMIDVIVDTFSDFRLAVGKWFYESDEATKKNLEKPLFETTIPFYLEKFDSKIKENGGFLANGKLSWGDIYFVAVSGYVNHMLGFNMSEKYDNIKALCEKVSAIPKIKEWIAKCPAGI
uniref:glutathione transferase n=1 Tax=Sogatella furcifera TaxID=113103 RepID=J9Q4H0_SOGFU|nr:glutathione s-transferase S1 [Sogatella furcifera]